MTEANTDPARKGRRWNGFVCPGCRCVFRIPSEHDGRGTVCPSCGRLLRLPLPDEPTPRLATGSGAIAAAAGEGHGAEGHRHHRRRRRRRKEGSPRWESVRHRSKLGRPRGGKVWLWASGAVAASFLALFGLMRIFGGSRTQSGEAAAVEDLALPPVSAVELAPPAEAAPEPPAAVPEAAPPVADPAAVQRQTEEMARRFVAARAVDELLPLVRDPAATAPKIRAWFERNGPPEFTLQRFAQAGEIEVKGSFVHAPVTLGDFTRRQMDLEQTADGFRIDWESWVGWSELPWDEFRRQRPTRAKLFRVAAKAGEYYNFGFADDRVWRCYELDEPYGSELLYGYLERGSELDKQLVPGPADDQRALVLRLRFPPDALSDNQVVIDSVVATGWAVGARKGRMPALRSPQGEEGASGE